VIVGILDLELLVGLNQMENGSVVGGWFGVLELYWELYGYLGSVNSES
jgi:hypothetical protein